MNSDVCFGPAELEVVRFCAKECELQQSGELSVGWMLEAYQYALERRCFDLDEERILDLGALIEPAKNRDGYRQVGVRVGWNVKMDWRLVPDAMAALIGSQDTLTAAEFFREYEEIHPWRDGNGRTGVILYNWLRGSLDAPVWAPNLWDDPRRDDLPVGSGEQDKPR